MKTYALAILAFMVGTAAMAQTEAPLGKKEHAVLPFPSPEITNLYFPGYQTIRDEAHGDRLLIVKLAHRKDPTRVYAAQIGDYIGDYRFDRTTDLGKNMALYFVKSNETVIIRARRASETGHNTTESGAGYRSQSAPQIGP